MSNPPVPNARLSLRQIGSHEVDDVLEVWEVPEGIVLVVVDGVRPQKVTLGAGDVLAIDVRDEPWGTETRVSLVRGEARSLLASGTVTPSTDGIHGPTLATKLAPLAKKAGFVVELSYGAR